MTEKSCRNDNDSPNTHQRRRKRQNSLEPITGCLWRKILQRQPLKSSAETIFCAAPFRLWLLSLFQPLYYTAVMFIGVVPVIIYTHSQYLAHISLQRLGVMPVLYLPDSRIDCPVIFQFYHQRRFLDRGQRKEYHIRIAPARGSSLMSL